MWSTAIRRKLLDMPRQSARAPQIHSFEQFMQRPGDQDRTATLHALDLTVVVNGSGWGSCLKISAQQFILVC
jgi:hypothetical protein